LGLGEGGYERVARAAPVSEVAGEGLTDQDGRRRRDPVALEDNSVQLQGTIALKRTAGTQVSILVPLITAPALS